MKFGADPTFGGNISSPATSEFKYMPPTGFRSLCTTNLSAPEPVPSEQIIKVLSPYFFHNPEELLR